MWALKTAQIRPGHVSLIIIHGYKRNLAWSNLSCLWLQSYCHLSTSEHQRPMVHHRKTDTVEMSDPSVSLLKQVVICLQGISCLMMVVVVSLHSSVKVEPKPGEILHMQLFSCTCMNTWVWCRTSYHSGSCQSDTDAVATSANSNSILMQLSVVTWVLLLEMLHTAWTHGVGVTCTVAELLLDFRPCALLPTLRTALPQGCPF